MSEKWDTDIRHQFPDWLTSDAILRWLDFDKPNVGDTFTGTVIARAPFGVWLDIGIGFPALLLAPNMIKSHRSIESDDYPKIGDAIFTEIIGLSVGAEITLLQIENKSQT